MERQTAIASVEINLHQLIFALEHLADEYPCDRLAPVQIERIETAARILRERLAEYRARQIDPSRCIA